MAGLNMGSALAGGLERARGPQARGWLRSPGAISMPRARWLPIVLCLALVAPTTGARARTVAELQAKAEAGDINAAFELALRFDYGKGVPEDNRRAMELYTRAADLGFVSSMVNLAIMYRNGEGAPVDLREAFKWIDLARVHTQRSSDRRLKWQIRSMQDRLKSTMTAAEVADGEARARQWYAARKPGDGG